MPIRLLSRSYLSALAILLVGCTQSAPEVQPNTGNVQGAQTAEKTKTSQIAKESVEATQEGISTSQTAAVDGSPAPTANETNSTEVSPVAFPAVPHDAGQLRQLAQQTAEQLIASHPASADAQEVKARFHMLVGETDAARQCWEAALQLVPEYPYALHGLGQFNLQASNFEEAARFLERAQQGQPDSAEVVKDLSRAYTKLGDVEKAAKVLSDFSALHPEHTETLVLLGQAHQALREFESAKEAYERALELSPSLPRAQQCLGTVLMRLGDRKRAKELLQTQRDARQAEILPSQDEVFRSELTAYATRFVFAAQVYLGNGNIPDAQRTLLIAASCDPANQQAWSLLLDIQRQTGNLPASLVIAKKMCTANPQVASYAYTLGVLQTEAKLFDQARVSFRRVIELAPQSTQALQSLILLNLREQVDLNETAELATTLTTVRGSASDYDLLGQAQASLRDFDAAKRSLEKAIELAPDNQRYQKAMEQLMLFLK